MPDTEPSADKAATARPSRLPLMIGLVLAVMGGGGGFFAVRAGILPIADASTASASETAPEDDRSPDYGDLAYVPIEPLVVSYSQDGRSRHLRFRAELEVPEDETEEVTRLMPRVVDVLNTYLRALRISDLEESTALLRLRAHMLRRVQAVVGHERINDLLVMEFVLD
jgi:flagellar FliL protein